MHSRHSYFLRSHVSPAAPVVADSVTPEKNQIPYQRVLLRGFPRTHTSELACSNSRGDSCRDAADPRGHGADVCVNGVCPDEWWRRPENELRPDGGDDGDGDDGALACPDSPCCGASADEAIIRHRRERTAGQVAMEGGSVLHLTFAERSPCEGTAPLESCCSSQSWRPEMRRVVGCEMILHPELPSLLEVVSH